MVNVVLDSEQGVLTHKVFAEGDEDGDAGEQSGDDADVTSNNTKTKEADILTTYRHTYVPEVVREKKIYF